MTIIASLDIETTGLNPKKDAIIEIGIRLFNGTRIEKDWSSLVNPNCHISEFITSLTGISNEMVRRAPTLHEILDEVSGIIGNFPILGQNVRFDLSFFERYHHLLDNPFLDTYEMAAVLLPSNNRYNLTSLARSLSIPQPASHRALDDAKTTHQVYIKLLDLVNELPIDILAEIINLGEALDWGGNWPFREVFRKRISNKVAIKPAKKLTHEYFEKSFDEKSYASFQNGENISSLDLDATASILGQGGAFSKYFPAFEHRSEQIEMSRSVAEALSNNQHLLIEAGTGVGKSLAYLVPASLFALQNNTRVVISTNTINLQDQLINKDIPDINAALGTNVRASVLKGRSNYLCPRKVDLLRRHKPQTIEELRVLAKILVWLQTEKSGDRTNINLTGPVERDVWNHLSAENDQCSIENCYEKTGGACPYLKARQASQNSHLLIVNHALLLADISSGNYVLPGYDYLIIDEGHHLESATTEALSFRFSEVDCARLIREIGSDSFGLLAYILFTLKGEIIPSEYAMINLLTTKTSDLIFRFENQQRTFFEILMEFAATTKEDQLPTTYSFQLRITPSIRTLPGWEDVEINWENSKETLTSLISILGDLQKTISQLATNYTDEVEKTIADLGSLIRRLVEIEKNLSSLVNQPDHSFVYWVEIQPNGNSFSLHASPIQVGSLLEKHLWHSKNSIILTSATLTTNFDFNYIRNSLGADEANELSLGSPFDYENSALLYIVNDIAEPHASDFQNHLNRSLLNMCLSSGGRALILFTSYAQLKRTSKAISSRLAEADIYVLEQGEGSSPNALLENFKTTEKAVLLGTKSFWEGIDVPGESLSVLAITKLPFDVPSDPLISSRAEFYDDPFNEYHLPEAILKFRQGFGRLIRTQSDRGVVVLFDRRVLSKSYGRMFIKSLPPCTKIIGSMADLPKNVKQWINK